LSQEGTRILNFPKSNKGSNISSDTTAASLSSLFFHLAQEPLQVKSLRKEIDEYFEEVSQVDSTGLSKLTYLNAIINEALRLHPPVPSGTQRVTPAEGLTIGDTFIPGNTTVQVPLHSVFRGKIPTLYRSSLILSAV